MPNSLSLAIAVHSDLTKSIWNSLSNNVSKKTLFIRHGSTTEIADPEEIMEIERERHETDPDGLENIALEISDLRSSVSDLRWWLERFESYFDRDRSIEYTFAGILSGILLGYLEFTGWLSPLFLALFISIMIAIISSGLKFVGFGLLRSIGVGVIVGVAYVLLSEAKPFLAIYLRMNQSPGFSTFGWSERVRWWVDYVVCIAQY